MNDLLLNDLEITSPSVVRQAARDFAAALAQTRQFQAYEQAEQRLRDDLAAQRVLGAYQSKQTSLRMALMLNAVSAEDRAELARLQRAFVAQPTIAAYLQAQGDLTALCQAAAEQLSGIIGLSFTAACGPGCC